MNCTYKHKWTQKESQFTAQLFLKKTSFWMARTAQLKIKLLLELPFAGSIAYMIGGLIANIISGVVEDSVKSKFDSHL